MSVSEKLVAVHEWEEKVGSAPYRLLGVISMPSVEAYGNNWLGYQNAMLDAQHQASSHGVHLGSCDVCGTGIMNHYVIRNADGVNFVAGCDCVEHSGDHKLVSSVKAEKLRRERKAREDRRRAEWEATLKRNAELLQEQRDRNGGLTDSEVAERAKQVEAKKVADGMYHVNGWLIDVLSPVGYSSSFIESMLDSLHCQPVKELSGRCLSILCDIYAKSFGRRNSKAYYEASERFDVLAGICNDEGE